MEMNKILESFDKLLKSANENKNILILILILLGIYYTYYSDSITEHCIYLFDNNVFKFTIFIIITYISSSSPAIGISLAIIMLVSLQLITYIKLKKELDLDIEKIESELDGNLNGNLNKEKFSQIEPADTSYLNDEYLIKPLGKINELAPPINFNLKLTTPNELSLQMIKQGKTMLNDSYNLEQDLQNRYDSREQQIANDTKRNGMDLVDSGIGRLQKANQGEYNKSKLLSNPSNSSNKFVSLYPKLIKKNNLSNPLIDSLYGELIYNYNLLTGEQLNEKDFDIQLEKVYLIEFNLLENIYKLRKSNYSKEKQQLIEKIINNLNTNTNTGKNDISSKLSQLYFIMN